MSSKNERRSARRALGLSILFAMSLVGNTGCNLIKIPSDFTLNITGLPSNISTSSTFGLQPLPGQNANPAAPATTPSPAASPAATPSPAPQTAAYVAEGLGDGR